MSNGRSTLHYFPLYAAVSPRQMAKHGNLWPWSTRVVEGRGAIYKRFARRGVCARKRMSEVHRAVRNVKAGAFSFKTQAYNSSKTSQMVRLAVSREESTGRKYTRLRTTGCTCLVRSLPKWQAQEAPPMGRLLDVAALEEMLVRVEKFFAASVALGIETDAVFPEKA